MIREVGPPPPKRSRLKKEKLSTTQRDLHKLLKDQELHIGLDRSALCTLHEEVRKITEEGRATSSAQSESSLLELPWVLALNPFLLGTDFSFWKQLGEGAPRRELLLRAPRSNVYDEVPAAVYAHMDTFRELLEPGSPWTQRDIKLLFDAALTYHNRWPVVADRVRFSFSPDLDQHREHGVHRGGYPDETVIRSPINPKALEVLYHTFVYRALCTSKIIDRHIASQHPLSPHIRRDTQETKEAGNLQKVGSKNRRR